MKHCKSAVSDTLRPLPESVTVCATVDDTGTEQVITDMMIRRACEQMDASQIWPMASELFAGAHRTLNTGTAQIIPFRPRAS